MSNIEEKEEKEEKEETDPDEEGGISIISHLVIIDKETGEELLNKRG